MQMTSSSNTLFKKSGRVRHPRGHQCCRLDYRTDPWRRRSVPKSLRWHHWCPRRWRTCENGLSSTATGHYRHYKYHSLWYGNLCRNHWCHARCAGRSNFNSITGRYIAFTKKNVLGRQTIRKHKILLPTPNRSDNSTLYLAAHGDRN